MNTAMKIVVFLFLWCFLCFESLFPKELVAAVVINEFLVKPSPQWIELYNNSETEVDISSWVIDDNGGSSSTYVIGDGILLSGLSCISFESSKFYWNTSSGDSVRLLSGEVLIDEYSYSSAPSDNVTMGRSTDGTGEILVLASSSRDKFNSTGESCIKSSSNPTPSPTSSSVSQKSTYAINDVKDENGNTLSQVKIYVDSQYTGNYTDETYTFCDSCKCGSNSIPCGFGSHTFKTEKDGYSDWSETKNIIAGETYEVSPVMNKENSSTIAPTSTPTKTPTPTPTKTPTPKPSTTPTSTPSISPEESPLKVQVLGAEIALSPTPIATPNGKKIPAFAYIFITVGVLVLGGGGYLLFLSTKKEYNGKTDGGQIEN